MAATTQEKAVNEMLAIVSDAMRRVANRLDKEYTDGKRSASFDLNDFTNAMHRIADELEL